MNLSAVTNSSELLIEIIICDFFLSPLFGSLLELLPAFEQFVLSQAIQYYLVHSRLAVWQESRLVHYY